MKKYLEEQTLFGHNDVVGFGDESFFVKEIIRDKANYIIKKNHYSKKFYSASYIHLGIFINNELLGVLQYGYAMNPASQESVVKNTGIKEYLELNRMWLDDKAGRNSESKAISYSIKYIKRKYPAIKWIQSFADERCGCFGIVYQAANFKYYGEHTTEFYELDGEMFHRIQFTVTPNDKRYNSVKHLQDRKDEATVHKLRQFRYIYFIDKRCIRDCLLTEKPYPKHYKEKTN